MLCCRCYRDYPGSHHGNRLCPPCQQIDFLEYENKKLQDRLPSNQSERIETLELVTRNLRARIAELEAERDRWKREGAAEELDRLRDHIQEHVGPDDARDDIRRICANRAKDLRREAEKLRKGGE